jgi:hypothetical protein
MNKSAKLAAESCVGQEWIGQELAAAQLPDMRLEKRLQHLVEQMAAGLGRSIPLACQDWSATKAAYRFFSNERICEEQILAGHFEATRERLPQAGAPVLVLHDTTPANAPPTNRSSRSARVDIDNNVSEREMKRVVLNRKNSLFVGNPRGGRTAAILASLTSTCRRHDIDPQLYLTQLLTNLSQVRKSDLANWLPDKWKQLQAVRTS